MKLLRFASVRARLTLLNVVVLSLTLAAFGSALYYGVATRLNTRVDQALQARTRLIVNWWPVLRESEMRERLQEMRDRRGRLPFEQDMPVRAEEAGLGNLPAALTGGLSPYGESQRGQVYAPRLLTADGRTAYLSGRQIDRWDAVAAERAAATGVGGFSTVVREGAPVRVYTVALRANRDSGPVQGVLQMAESLKETHAELGRLARFFLLLTPAALLMAGAGAAFLTHRAMLPVRDITTAAAELEAKNLAARLPVNGSDEFAHLAVTFNGMLGRLESAFDRLERAVEQQRQFTADASHELKTPLAIARMGVGLALSRDRTPEEYRKALLTIDGSLERMTRLVTDLLLLARTDEGQTAFTREPVPLRGLLEEAAAPFRQGENRLAIAVVVEGPPETWETLSAYGDPGHLGRVFRNLLENAVRHTPPTGRVTLTARADTDKETVQVFVADTGEGIAPEHLPYLFDRFYRADPARARAQGGTGLGLSICREIVSLHGGGIRIESHPGQGTRVCVTLPRAR